MNIGLKISILKSIYKIADFKKKKNGKTKLNHISSTVSIQQEVKANHRTLTLPQSLYVA